MLQFPRWKVDVTVGRDLVKTLYETATTSKAAINKAKHKLRGAVSSAGAFKFKATKVDEKDHAAKKKTSAKRNYQYRANVTGTGLLIGGGKRHTSSWFDTKKEADDWAWAISEGNQAAGRPIAFVSIERKHNGVTELIKWAHAGEVEI